MSAVDLALEWATDAEAALEADVQVYREMALIAIGLLHDACYERDRLEKAYLRLLEDTRKGTR